MSYLIFLILILSAACVPPLSEEIKPKETNSSNQSFICATPTDASASAEITITVKDASITPKEGRSFSAWSYEGDVPGPVIRMNLGETKQIKLVNASPRPASLHFHGVKYTNSDDGTPEHPESMVNPGCAHVYTITAVQPGAWPYHSHQDSRKEMAQGLYGAVIVPFPNEAAANHEFVIFLGQLGIEEPEAVEAKEESKNPFFMTINGRPDGNAEVIELQGNHYIATSGVKATTKVGDRVRWRILNVSPDDPHTFHIHGHRWCDRGGIVDKNGLCSEGSKPVDNLELLPAQGTSFEFIEDNPGEWMFHCHILDHMTDGMFAFYQVNPS